MSTPSAMRQVVLAGARTSEGPIAGPAIDLEERKGPLRVEPPVDPLDAEAGSWVNAAAQAFGDLSAFATQIGVDLSYLGKMRKGTKPLSGAHLVRMKGQVDAVLALVAPLLESIGHVARPVIAPTFVQLAGAVLADLDDGSAVTRQLIESAARKRGWTTEQVARALHRDNEP